LKQIWVVRPNNKRGISRPLHVNMCLVRKYQLDSPVSICCKSVHSLVNGKMLLRSRAHLLTHSSMLNPSCILTEL
jgi:hypothetical protein